MDFGLATQLQAVILEQIERGEIAPDVSTQLEQDEISRVNGIDMWRVIVEWPDHKKRAINSFAQWDQRKSEFVLYEEEEKQ